MMPVEQIKSQLDIVGVVDTYAKLKQQGTGPQHVGLCPFHSEKTLSFEVHAKRRRYKCFGCGTHGNVFTFVRKIENLTFPKTLRHGIVVGNATPLPRGRSSQGSNADRLSRGGRQ
jgi:DNA primase